MKRIFFTALGGWLAVNLSTMAAAITGLTTDPQGSVYVARCVPKDQYDYKFDKSLQIFDSCGKRKGEISGNDFLGTYRVHSSAADSQGNIYISATIDGSGKGAILKAAPTSLGKYSVQPWAQSWNPRGVCLSPDGHFLYVVTQQEENAFAAQGTFMFWIAATTG